MKTHTSTLLNRVVRKSRSSPCRYRVVAIGIDHRGTIISIRTNGKRFLHKGGGWHAEELVIHSSPRSLAKVLIARVSNGGKLLPIDPCEKCCRLADKYSVKIERLTRKDDTPK